MDMKIKSIKPWSLHKFNFDVIIKTRKWGVYLLTLFWRRHYHSVKGIWRLLLRLFSTNPYWFLRWSEVLSIILLISSFFNLLLKLRRLIKLLNNRLGLKILMSTPKYLSKLWISNVHRDVWRVNPLFFSTMMVELSEINMNSWWIIDQISNKLPNQCCSQDKQSIKKTFKWKA